MESQREPSTPSPPSQRTGPRSKPQLEHPSDPSNSTTSNTILPEKQRIASPKSRRHVAAVNFLSSIAFGHESMSPQSFSPLQNWGSIPQGRQTMESLQNAALENGFPNTPATPYQLASTSQNQQETLSHPLNVSITELPSVGTPRMETARVLSARDEAATQFLMNISLGESAIKRKESQLSNMTTANLDPFASNQLPTPGLYGSPSLDSHSKFLRGQFSDGSISIDTKFNSLHRRSQHPSVILDSTLLSPVTPRPSTLKRVNVIYSSSFNKNRASLIDELSNSAVMFTTSGGQPFAMFSCLRYHDEKWKQKQKRQKMKEVSTYMEKLSTLNDNMKKRKPESFAHLLDPAGTLTETGPSTYDPYYLDHPDLKSGKHRTVISLPCFMGSIIQYTKPTDLKKELNEQFRETHPNIDSSLKLSHIRSLKRKLLNIIQQEDLEISSLAKSYAYLEKLIIKGLVNKSNRKLYAGVCLFLATKVNEPKGMNFGALLDAIYKHLSITPKEIKDQEFTVFASLDFSLYLPRSEFLPHFERIFALLDYKNINEYLGDNPFFLTKS